MQENGPSRLNDFLISLVIAGFLSPFVIIMISIIANDFPPIGVFIGLWIVFAIIGTIIFFIISLVIRAVQGPKNHSTSNPPNYQTPYQQPPPPSNKADSFKSLEQLAQLKDKGIVSEEEFQEQKNKILNP
jgi:hypothetical protein